MPFCKACGTAYGEGDAFCPQCGAGVSQATSAGPLPGVPPTLTAYVAQCRQKGIPDGEIAAALAKAGWTSYLVEAALASDVKPQSEEPWVSDGQDGRPASSRGANSAGTGNLLGPLGIIVGLFFPIGGIILGILSLTRKEKDSVWGAVAIIVSVGVWIYAMYTISQVTTQLLSNLNQLSSLY